VQERVEASAFGRAIISALVVFAIGSIVVWTMPNSEIKNRALPLVEPFVRTAGLAQNFEVFAPDPRRETQRMHAVVTLDDGTTRTWRFPDREPALHAYSDYRWQKLMEHLWGNDAALLTTFSQWVARHVTPDGRRAVRVDVVRRWAPLRPAGTGNHFVWQQDLHFVYRIGAGQP
jgi:hypothetical protein